jgi:ABC-type polysaccharide/polyol phosphate export permease
VLYPAETVPEPFRFTLEINPIAVLLVMYHSLILDGVVPPLLTWVYAGAWAGLGLLVGNFLYTRYRDSFAELL